MSCVWCFFVFCFLSSVHAGRLGLADRLSDLADLGWLNQTRELVFGLSERMRESGARARGFGSRWLVLMLVMDMYVAGWL